MKKFSELIKEKKFEELTFEKFFNEQKTENNNIEKLWEEYENLKFDHGELFNKFLGYNEYQRYIYGYLIENLSKFKNNIETNFKDTLINNKKQLIEATWLDDFRIKLKFRNPVNIDKINKLCEENNVFIYKVVDELMYTVVYIEENDMKDVSEKIYNNSNGILYHITSKDNVEKILKYGLEPRSENKKGWHPKRIYFCDFNSDTEKIKKFGEILNDDKYCVLKIDLKQQPRYKIKFFEDPQTDLVKAYYTRESIPPMCISKVDNIKLNKLLVNIGEISSTIKSKILNFTNKFLHF